eukprot:jgi/Psemu1/40747/gm1.40747_g
MATLEILSIFCTGTCMIDDGDSEDEDPFYRRLKDRRTPRIVAICRHCQSSFTYLFNSGNEQALLNCCGVDHNVFCDLLHLFQPANATCCLGLALFWFRTRGSVARISSMAFGLTSTVMITLPNKVEMEEYISAIGAKYPALHEKRVWGAADGLKLLIQHSDNWLIQSQYYNGWTCDTYVSSVFVFAPDGRICITAFNCPGSWHDSTVADYGVYDQMQEMFDEYGAMLTVDAAFKVRLLNYLIQSLQANQVGAEALVLNHEATSLRKLSEWGMPMIQEQFPQLKDRLLLEDFGDRNVILNVMMLLYNYQTSTVGHKQILNVFMHKKNGYFSYNTGPTEDVTGMFE